MAFGYEAIEVLVGDNEVPNEVLNELFSEVLD